MTYNYLEAVKDDIKEYLRDNIELKEYTREELQEKLNDDLWFEDSVTGNASGSYYCNAWRAEEALAHNWDLLAEALEEFGDTNFNVLRQGAEACDVTIRCYLLGQAIDEVLDEIDDDEFKADYENEEDED